MIGVLGLKFFVKVLIFVGLNLWALNVLEVPRSSDYMMSFSV